MDLVLLVNIINYSLEIYSIIMIVYIWLTWIPRFRHTYIGQLVERLVDPYLSIFRQFKILHFNGMDFSPIVALLFLKFMQSLLSKLAMASSITFAFLLGFVVQAFFTIINALLGFFMIIAVIRLITLFIFSHAGPFLTALDMMLKPMVHFVESFFGTFNRVSYGIILAIVALLTFLSQFGVSFVSAYAVFLVNLIPF